MSVYPTGEATEGMIAIQDSHQVATPDSPIAYDAKRDLYQSGSPHPTRPPSTSNANGRASQPLPLSPSIRREIDRAIDLMRQSVDAMEIAHEGEGIDVVELANAIEDYRKSVNTLWTYREFGMESWRRVIGLTVQAISENQRDEEMSPRQCEGLKNLVNRFLSNRHLVKDDVRNAMALLRDSDFDTLAFFSQQMS